MTKVAKPVFTGIGYKLAGALILIFPLAASTGTLIGCHFCKKA
jgi:hypothetical protein